MSFQDYNYSSTKYADIVIPLLQGKEYKIKGVELNCCCPFHEEQHASFGINLETGAYNCFSCGEKGSIVDFVSKIKNISNEEAWKEIQKEIGDFETQEQKSNPYTLDMYADEKKLNKETLQNWGVHTSDNGTSVAIPYFDENSKLLRTRFRNGPDNEVRFYWGNDGNDTTLYGIWNNNAYTGTGIILVERRK